MKPFIIVAIVTVIAQLLSFGAGLYYTYSPMPILQAGMLIVACAIALIAAIIGMSDAYDDGWYGHSTDDDEDGENK